MKSSTFQMGLCEQSILCKRFVSLKKELKIKIILQIIIFKLTKNETQFMPDYIECKLQIRKYDE